MVSAAKNAAKVTDKAVASVKKAFPDVGETHIRKLIAHYGTSAAAIKAIKFHRDYKKVFG